MQVIKRRAERFYATEEALGCGRVVSGDSQQRTSFREVPKRVTWIVTSPPYYGMRTSYRINGFAGGFWEGFHPLTIQTPDNWRTVVRMISAKVCEPFGTIALQLPPRVAVL